MFHFEEIFDPIIVLWRKEYPFSESDRGNSFIKSLSIDYENIEQMFENEIRFNSWDVVVNFVIYQVLTEYALNEIHNVENKGFTIIDIPIYVFERQWRDNFLYHTDLEFINNYNGLKDPKHSEMTLNKYLQLNSLALK